MALYVYDGSFEGLLTAVFEVFKLKDLDGNIIAERDFDGSSLFDVVTVETAQDKAGRVWKGIRDKLSYAVLQDIYYIYLSDYRHSGDIALRYICDGFEKGRRIRSCFDLDSVNKAIKLRNKVQFEVHRFKGLLRFKSIGENAYVADIEPDHNIAGLLAPHFTNRYGGQNWLIRDLKRHIGAVHYAGDSEWNLIELTGEQMSLQYTDHFETMWKGYYKAINIEERKNPKCQLRLMPKRYWKHLVERD